MATQGQDDSEEVVFVEVLNWEKYNPRSDVKHPSWFRMEHSLFEESDFFDFTHAELIAWIYILSIASKKNSARIMLNIAHVEKVGRLRLSDLESALRKLQRNGCLKRDVTYPIRTRNVSDTDSHATRRDGTLRNEILGSTEGSKKLDPFGAIEEFSGDSETETFLKSIRKTTQKRWLKLYSDNQWLRSELLKAIAWIEVNPQRAPKKNFARFTGGWLSRGWEKHRKTIGPSTSRNLKPINLEEDIA